MNQTTADIVGKRLKLWKPYEPLGPHSGRLIGRERELRLVAAAWMAGTTALPLAPLLVGPPGVGKNRLVYELARQFGKKLYIFQGHDDVAAEDLACMVRFNDDDHRKMEYTASPLVTAMHLGQICFIDEIAKIRPRALSLLVSVLDERRYIDSNLLGDRIVAADGFRFVAATNSADLEGNALPEFIKSRLHPRIDFGYPKREEIGEIVRDQFLQDETRVADLIDGFWSEWGKLGIPNNPTPREAICVFSLAQSLADSEGLNEARRMDASVADHVPKLTAPDPRKPIGADHIAQAMRDLSSDFVKA